MQSSCYRRGAKHAKYRRFLRECSEQEKASESKIYEEHERQSGSFSEGLAEAQDVVETLEMVIDRCERNTRKERKVFGNSIVQRTKLPQ